MTIITTLILSILMLYLAKRSGFLSLAFTIFKAENTIRLCIKNFVIFILVAILTPPILINILPNPKIISLLLPLLIIIILFFYNLQHRELFFSILKQKTFPGRTNFFQDCLLGLIGYGVAIFPYLFINNTLLVIVEKIFGKINESQLAVQALKELPVNLIVVIIFAPLLEEFLFRGLLQNALRQKLKAHAAIQISSIVFALFHFNTAQGMLNLVLLPALYTFALTLGFIYEKSRSLISPIILHSTFNIISAIYILYLN